MGKRKGGQTNNLNAAKHGFYSRHFSEDEMALVAAFCTDPSLDDEIAMQRVANLRVVQALGEIDTSQLSDREQLARLHEALSMGLGRVAKLLRDKRALSGEAADGLQNAITKALDEIATEMGVAL